MLLRMGMTLPARGTYTCHVKRFRPRLAAWLALVAVCFVQMATAAHACTLVDAAARVPLAHTAEAHCAGMTSHEAPVQGPLCLEHCNTGQKLFDHHSPVALMDPPVIDPIIVALTAGSGGPQLPRPALIPPDTSPQVFAWSGRFRI